jgi:mono/diheme cytochrome c family protein
MKLNRILLGAVAGVVLIAAKLLADNAVPSNSIATMPVYVPDMSHVIGSLPDGVLAWNDLMKSVEATADQDEAHFTFNFTNVSPGNVTILDAHGSCGCTTAQLPQLPWTIPPGTNGQIGVTVNLNATGKSGSLLKTVNVSTDKGSKVLMVRISFLPPVIRVLTDEERAQQMAAAKVDRQAVFKNDCASCHAKPATGKYGQELYTAVCGICHDAEHRATIVPDLHAIKTPTNNQFWQVWIAHGKPGSLMPAFSITDGGPLTDMQIANLATYLDTTIPSHAAPTPQ